MSILPLCHLDLLYPEILLIAINKNFSLFNPRIKVSSDREEQGRVGFSVCTSNKESQTQTLKTFLVTIILTLSTLLATHLERLSVFAVV